MGGGNAFEPTYLIECTKHPFLTAQPQIRSSWASNVWCGLQIPFEEVKATAASIQLEVQDALSSGAKNGY
jgi:hypothetical protein